MQEVQKDAPSKKGREATGGRGVDHVVKKHTARQFDERGLCQKSQWRVGQRKIAVRNVAQRNAVRIFQDVAEVPENPEPEVLPQDDSSGSKKESRG